jgi:hypothetical protein
VGSCACRDDQFVIQFAVASSTITATASNTPSRRTNATSTITSGSRITRAVKNTWIQRCGAHEYASIPPRARSLMCAPVPSAKTIR